MSEHRIQLNWSRTTPDFNYATYTRNHTVTFKGGQELDLSASPAYKGDPKRADPEDALVAALSSCHMLSFLALAAKMRLVVDQYEDDAVGVMEKNAEGRLAITKVTLRPRVRFGGAAPDAATHQQLHDEAHHACFIANSVKTEVSVELPAGVT